MKILKIFSRKNYYDSRAFFERCPDLAPRNVYLYNNRVIRTEEIDRYFDKITMESATEGRSDSIKNFVRNLFRRKK